MTVDRLLQTPSQCPEIHYLSIDGIKYLNAFQAQNGLITIEKCQEIKYGSTRFNSTISQSCFV